MLALTAAWYWAHHPNQRHIVLNTATDNLPLAGQVTQAQFDVISGVVASDRNSYPNRFNSYTKNMNFIQKGGNPYESMQEVLQQLGLKTANTVGYEKQLGIIFSPLNRCPLTVLHIYWRRISHQIQRPILLK